MTWLFQGDPKYYRVRPALTHFHKTGHLITWLVNTHRKEIKAGDEVFFWQSGPDAALVGWGTIETDPADIALEDEGLPFVVVRAKFEGPKPRVRIRVDGICYRTRASLLNDSVLSKWKVLRGVQGTNFAIPPEMVPELRRAAEVR